MPPIVIIMATFGFGIFLLSGCLGGRGEGAPRDGRNESVYTSLKVNSCAQAIDQNDPDDTPYFVCPGAYGYDLQIRQVEAGRVSINLVNPSKQQFPLNYQDVVTRSMASLADKAEWRIRHEGGKRLPVALIVGVMAREDGRDPEKITNTYLAVAKVAASGACVTDKIRQGATTAMEVLALADSAASRPCLPQLPVTASDEIRQDHE